MAQRDFECQTNRRRGGEAAPRSKSPEQPGGHNTSKWGGRLRAALLGMGLALLAIYPQDAMQAAKDACTIWASGVMPALFPYMVISQMLTSAVRLPYMTVPLSMLGGSPAGARLIALNGYRGERAQHLAALCVTASPLYILGTLGGGLRMLLAHWLGAVIAWAFTRLICGAPKGGAIQATGASASLPEAVRDASLAMIAVCGCMALFSVLTALLTRLLPMQPPLSALLGCVLEMATGCARILALGLPAAQAAPLVCAAVSFGGLSIFMQNAVFLRPSGVNPRVQLLARIVHAASAYGLCTLFYLS